MNHRPGCRLLAAVALLCAWTGLALGLATEHFGNAPMPPGWGEQMMSKELIPLANHQSRIYWREVNGDPHFFYQGNTATLNEVLKLFASTEPREVILVPGPGEVQSLVGEKRMRCDWSLHTPSGLWMALARKEKGTNALAKIPTLTIFVTQIKPEKPVDENQVERWLADLDSSAFPVRQKATQELQRLGNAAGPALRTALAAQTSPEKRQRIGAILATFEGIDLEQLQIPDGLRVIGVEQLRQRYLEGLKSAESEIRGHAVGGLGGLRRHGEDILPTLLDLLKTEKHEWVRRYAASVLSGMGANARAALPILKAGLDDPDQNVRNFYRHAIESIENSKEPAAAPEVLAEKAKRQRAIRERIVAFCKSREKV